MSIRVLLVDDHVMFREALRVMLSNVPDIEVVGEAADGAEVGEVVARVQPDVVVMDISMPGVNGIEATRNLLALHPRIRVVALSAFVYKQLVRQMIEAGAMAFVAKAGASADLLQAVRCACEGKTYLCSEAKATMAETGWRGLTAGLTGVSEKATLARREIEVLRLLAKGKSSPEIAQELGISVGTVDVHRRNIMNKLDLHSVAELTKYAVRLGIVDL